MVFGSRATGFKRIINHENELNEFGNRMGEIPLPNRALSLAVENLKAKSFTERKICDCIGVASFFAAITRIVDSTGCKFPFLLKHAVDYGFPFVYFFNQNMLTKGFILLVFAYFVYRIISLIY